MEEQWVVGLGSSKGSQAASMPGQQTLKYNPRFKVGLRLRYISHAHLSSKLLHSSVCLTEPEFVNIWPPVTYRNTVHPNLFNLFRLPTYENPTQSSSIREYI